MGEQLTAPSATLLPRAQSEKAGLARGLVEIVIDHDHPATDAWVRDRVDVVGEAVIAEITSIRKGLLCRALVSYEHAENGAPPLLRIAITGKDSRTMQLLHITEMSHGRAPRSAPDLSADIALDEIEAILSEDAPWGTATASKVAAVLERTGRTLGGVRS